MNRTAARQAASELESMTDRISKKDINWWLALFTLLMMAVLAVLIWWIGTTLIDTMKENTQALTRCAAALERVERLPTR